MRLESVGPSRFRLLVPALFALAVPAFLGVCSARTFQPSADYAIYTHFAEAVSRGINPYSVPPDFRSETIRSFFPVGWTQPEPGSVRQLYAAEPPWTWIVYSAAFRLHPLKGLYFLFLSLFALATALFVVYALRREKTAEPGAPRVDPLWYLAFLALNPLVYRHWFFPIGDKVWFILFLLLILISRDRPWWVAAFCGLFAALKGLGLPVMLFYLLYMTSRKGMGWKRALGLALLFGAIVAVSHLPWFPDWIKAYGWRAERQTFVRHDSLFVPLDRIGLFRAWMPPLLAGLAFLLLGFLTVRGAVTLEEALLLPVALSIVFNTEPAFNRLLVAILAILLAAPRAAIVAASYALGLLLLLTTRGSALSWILVWGWMLSLLVATGWRIASRHRQAALPQRG